MTSYFLCVDIYELIPFSLCKETFFVLILLFSKRQKKKWQEVSFEYFKLLITWMNFKQNKSKHYVGSNLELAYDAVW